MLIVEHFYEVVLLAIYAAILIRCRDHRESIMVLLVGLSLMWIIAMLFADLIVGSPMDSGSLYLSLIIAGTVATAIFFIVGKDSPSRNWLSVLDEVNLHWERDRNQNHPEDTAHLKRMLIMMVAAIALLLVIMHSVAKLT